MIRISLTRTKNFRIINIRSVNLLARRKTTDIESIKATAIEFTYIPLEPTFELPFLVKHPCTNSRYVPLRDDAGEIYAADLFNEADLSKWQSMLENQIRSTDELTSIYTMFEKTYRLALLKYTESYLSADDLSKVLRFIWCTTEFPNGDPNLSKAKLCKLFSECVPSELMTPDELQAYEQFPDIVHVYRGVRTGLERDAHSLSWTINPQKAAWFAHRFNTAEKQGIVFEADSSKSDILAYFDIGGEDEVVVRPSKLQNIQKTDIQEEL